MLSASLLAVLLALPLDDSLDNAESLRREGRLDDAIATLQEALDAGPSDARAVRLALARLHLERGEGLEALTALEGLDAQGDHDVAVLSGRGHRLAADQVYFAGAEQDEINGHFDEAIGAYERAIELSGLDPSPAVWHLGEIYLYVDSAKDPALDLARQVLDEVPDDPYGLLLRGAAQAFVYYEHFSAGDTEAANAAWQEGVDDLQRADELLDDDVTDALGQLVWYYEAQGMGMKAVETARTIVDRQSPPNLALLYNLARKYRDLGGQGNLEASGNALEKMVDLDGEALTGFILAEEDSTAVAVSLAGSIDPFYRRNDRGTCRRILAAIVAADPADAQTWHNYAVICEETSRFEDAVKAYEKEIELDPQNPRAYNDLGSVLANNLRRETDRARELFEKCIALAEEQVNQLDATEDQRANAREAINVARGNLNSLQPAASSGGLLDSMMDSLRNLNLPEDDEEGEDGEETADDNGGADDGGDGQG